MFKTKILRLSNDDRQFYQWDTERKLIVNDNTCDKVYFSNDGMEMALTCNIYEVDGVRMVNVPNIILQDAKPLKVHLSMVDNDGRLTTYYEAFHVAPRKKPNGYVYTETEVLNYASLDKRLNALEGEGLAQAVAGYLEENPIEAGATKEEAAQIQQNKTDIENLSKNKLDVSALPEAVNDALEQAKASGEFKGDPGEKGDPGDDYVLTPTDKQEIAELAAEMVEVPEGGSVELDTTLTEDGKAADAKAVGDALNVKVTGMGITAIIAITQAAYNELEKKDLTTLYIITDATGEEDSGSGGDSDGNDTPTNMVPYLLGDGVAYINLGVQPTENMSFELCMRDSTILSTARENFFGNLSYSLSRDSKTNDYINANYKGGYNGQEVQIASKKRIKITPTDFIVDDQSVKTITQGDKIIASNMYLFTKNDANTSNGLYISEASIGSFTFFYLKLWDGEELTHHFVPAKDSEGVACVYDEITKTYLYNANGTGEFVYGTELEES